MTDFEKVMKYCEEESVGTVINGDKTIVSAYIMGTPVLEWHFSKDGKLLETVPYNYGGEMV